MTTLAELESAAPSIAAFVADRLEKTGLCFLGTTRADGWPRVSPLEVFVQDGRIYMGSMPDAVKAQDLRRDGRCCIITPLADKDDMAGEGKLFCQAREITEQDEWEAVRATVKARSGFDMGEPGDSHLFTFDIEGAAWQRVEGGTTFRTTSWNPQHGVRERGRDAEGKPIDV
jgi:hypothetical protein